MQKESSSCALISLCDGNQRIAWGPEGDFLRPADDLNQNPKAGAPR